jgi:hypothetical protein
MHLHISVYQPRQQHANRIEPIDLANNCSIQHRKFCTHLATRRLTRRSIWNEASHIEPAGTKRYQKKKTNQSWNQRLWACVLVMQMNMSHAGCMKDAHCIMHANAFAIADQYETFVWWDVEHKQSLKGYLTDRQRWVAVRKQCKAEMMQAFCHSLKLWNILSAARSNWW